MPMSGFRVFTSGYLGSTSPSETRARAGDAPRPEGMRTVTRQADVAIVGGGVMGSSIAYFLTTDPTETLEPMGKRKAVVPNHRRLKLLRVCD